MRKIFLILVITLISFPSCKEKNVEDSHEESIKQQMRKKISYEIKNGSFNDTILLGFTFGMSKKEYDTHAKNLYQKGKLHKYPDGRYVYLMAGVNDTMNLNLKPTFDKQSLYYLELYAKNQTLANHEIISMLENKYGKVHFVRDDGEYSGARVWSIGNRIIAAQSREDGFYLEYLDIKRYRTMKERDSLAVIKKAKSEL